MALNLDKIRAKVAQLNGDRSAGDVKVSKVLSTLGEHRIRLLPWKDLADGEVFKERQVYFKIGKSWITSPNSFGDPDPIQEFAKTLWQSGTEEDKALAKKLFPQHLLCVAMIDRAAEDEGPQLLVLNKKQAADILGFILDGDYGDVFDLHGGFDLKIKVKETDKIFNNKKVKEAKIECSPKSTPASADPAKVEKWMAALPDVDAYYKRKSYGEIKKQFEDWMNAGGPNASAVPASDADGTERGKSASSSAVDKLAEELNGSSEKKDDSKKEDKKPRQKKASVEDELDAAFNEIEQEV